MRLKKIFSSNMIGWLILLAAIALLYTSYFFIYIPNQEEIVKKRSFRILKEYAGNMNEKYHYYEKHLDNYNEYYNLKYLSKNSSNKIKNVLNDAITSDSILNNLLNSLEPSIKTTTEKSLNSRFTIVYQREKKNLRIEYSQASGKNLQKLLNVVTPPDKYKKDINDTLKLLAKNHFVHEVPFSTLMQGLKFDNLLNNITLFIDSAVVYNSNLEVVNAITNPAALVDSIKNQQGGIVKLITVGGEINHVMILPFDFEGFRFYLAGFITADRFDNKTRSISGQLIIIIAGFLLLILIGMPVLKIIFLGKNERLHTLDANAAIISFILGVSILVLIASSILKHNVYDKILNARRLENISAELYSNVDDNINQIIDIYEKIIIPNKTSELALLTRNFFKKEIDSLEKRYMIIPAYLQRKSFPVNELFLMNEEGSIDKAVTRTAFYGPLTIDVSQRFYFINIHDASMSWPINIPANRKPVSSFYLESIKSYNTGYAEAAFSFRLDPATKELFGSPYLAITSHVPAFYDQVLPADVEFLIINEDGDVMFHSNQSKSLHENFLAESNFSKHLQDAIKHRTTTRFRLNYNEKPWLAKIKPLKHMPLYHITLIDLQQSQAKNARILIISSYFLLATFMCILIGYFIMILTRNKEHLESVHQWSLNWLLFNPVKRNSYLSLLIIQFILLLFQFAGLFIPGKPFNMFLYQLVFIVFSAFIAYALINKKSIKQKHKQFASWRVIVIILGIVLFLLTALAITARYLVLIPLVAIYISIYWIYKSVEHRSLKSNTSLFDKIYDYAKASFYTKNCQQKNKNRGAINQVTKNIYHIYLFFWLCCISVLPVLQFYDSVKRQENILWQKMQTEHIAEKNLEFQINYADRKDGTWNLKTRGEGIEDITIEKDLKLIKKIPSELSFADSIYSRLPVPIGNQLNVNGLIYDRNPTFEWYYKKKNRNAFYIKYSKAGKPGEIILAGPVSQKLHPIDWFLYFIIPVFLIALFIWRLQKYLSGNILNTEYIDWEMPKQPSWDKILNNNDFNRILLISFTSDAYLNETQKYYSKGEELAIIHASQLQSSDLNKSQLKHQTIVWLKGLGEYLKDEKRFYLITPKLHELLNNASGRLIIELPFDIDFIDENVDQKLEAANKEENNERFILNFQNELPVMLKDFYRYAGMYYLPEEKEELTNKDKDRGYRSRIEEEKLISLKYALKLRYYFIWNHLTRIEKLILYDLADDGLLNLKNRPLLNRLMLKGLIKFDPYPKLFAKSFQYFILHAIDPAETKLIEKELGQQGNWQNTKYLLWILLIPLIGFVFIAQGTSIEKVIGILSGGVAVVAGLMRVFDSSASKQSG